MGISTHLLDSALGRPAGGVEVSLARRLEGEWELLNMAETDANGRVQKLLPEAMELEPGLYRIHFDTAAYFREQSLPCLHPYVEIVFTVPPDGAGGEPHFHLPLLLTANGYTTYRGS